jgi:hypothetical protein
MPMDDRMQMSGAACRFETAKGALASQKGQAVTVALGRNTEGATPPLARRVLNRLIAAQ